MTDRTDAPEPADQPEPAPAEVIVRENRTVSRVWLIPLVAAGIAAWMVVGAYLERGPQIRITFERADGLEAGQTQIKYRNVTIGQVEEVSLGPDLDKVVVTARIDKPLAEHVGRDSRFWVVRPRIGAANVSGLDTLLSGAYIEFDPDDGPRGRDFTGLEQPPVTPGDAPGLRLALRAGALGSVTIGSQILYRDIAVGQVEDYRLRDNQIEIDAYIEEAYADLVRAQTRFWDVSGVDLVLDADGMRLSTASIDSVLRGGIAFETPTGRAAGDPVDDGAVFQLFGHYDDIGEEYGAESYDFIMYFENSVRGLTRGAPVEFRGIKIGVVTDVALEYDVDRMWLQIPVRVRLEPGRMRQLGADKLGFLETMAVFVERGLRARVETGNLLTGALYVALDFDGDAPLELRGAPGGPPEIPTLPSTTEQLMEGAEDFVARAQTMPLNELITTVVGTLDSVDRAATKLESQVDPLVGAMLATSGAASGALAQTQQALAGIAVLQADLSRALKELTVMAASFRRLADTLTRQPESLLRGKP